MSFKNRWTISSSYDFQAHLQRSQRRCCFPQTALLWFEVHPDLSPALPRLSPALPGAPRLVVSARRIVAGAPSYSEGLQECPPTVWYSPEIDASKFTLHILSDTPGGFQYLKYILLMQAAYHKHCIVYLTAIVMNRSLCVVWMLGVNRVLAVIGTLRTENADEHVDIIIGASDDSIVDWK
jgi:hypothetical protein